MANNTAFQAMGTTYAVNASNVTQTIVITPSGPCNQVMISNTGATSTGGNDVFCVFSQSSTVTATFPTPGNPQIGLFVNAGNQKVFTVPFQFSTNTPLYVALIANGSVPTYITPGEGL